MGNKLVTGGFLTLKANNADNSSIVSPKYFAFAPAALHWVYEQNLFVENRRTPSIANYTFFSRNKKNVVEEGGWKTHLWESPGIALVFWGGGGGGGRGVLPPNCCQNQRCIFTVHKLGEDVSGCSGTEMTISLKLFFGCWRFRGMVYQIIRGIKHCGLVTPYDDMHFGQHWFGQWLGAG